MRLHPSTSLRWQLIRNISLVILLIWGLAGYLSYSTAQHEAEELMDGNLAQDARRLLALSKHDNAEFIHLAQQLSDTSNGEYEQTVEFQLVAADGTVLVRSPLAPLQAISTQPGWLNLLRDGQEWRAFSLEDPPSKQRLTVLHTVQLRDAVALEIATRTTLPIGLALPLLIGLIYYFIKRTLQPLDALANEVASRSSDNLDPLHSQPASSELQTLAEAINTLLGRVHGALENERRFTADAAHELRTPLAAIKIHTELAQLSRQPEQQQQAIAQALQGVERGTRVIEQLLRLARLDPLSQPSATRRIDLCQLAQDLLDEQPGTTRQNIGLDIPADAVSVDADADLLSLAWRNLLENATRYSRPDSSIRLFIEQDMNGTRFGVTDNGPGCPPAELPLLQQRFYRGKASPGEGCGLGLAIVSRIAELHRAQLHLSNLPAGGFQASIIWPN